MLSPLTPNKQYIPARVIKQPVWPLVTMNYKATLNTNSLCDLSNAVASDPNKQCIPATVAKQPVWPLVTMNYKARLNTNSLCYLSNAVASDPNKQFIPATVIKQPVWPLKYLCALATPTSGSRYWHTAHLYPLVTINCTSGQTVFLFFQMVWSLVTICCDRTKVTLYMLCCVIVIMWRRPKGSIIVCNGWKFFVGQCFNY